MHSLLSKEFVLYNKAPRASAHNEWVLIVAADVSSPSPKKEEATISKKIRNQFLIKINNVSKGAEAALEKPSQLVYLQYLFNEGG